MKAKHVPENLDDLRTNDGCVFIIGHIFLVIVIILGIILIVENFTF